MEDIKGKIEDINTDPQANELSKQILILNEENNINSLEVENTNDFLKKNPDLEDKLYGAFLGLLIGDSIGSPVEFQSKLSDAQISECFKLNGARIHGTGPGQITDDGELALCLSQALTSKELDLNKIAKMYHEWGQSRPFDVGNTIRQAVFSGNSAPLGSRAALMKKGSIKSWDRQSNGALMRHVPFSLWCRNLSDDEITEACYEEATLTHPNPMCILSNSCYSILVKYTLQSTSRMEAFKQMTNYVTSTSFQTKIFQLYEKVPQFSQNYLLEFLKWIDLAQNNEEFDTLRNIGFVKIAFVISLRIFLKDMNYTESIKAMLKFAGDTDTNCAILGGLIGASLGMKNIEPEYIEKIVQCDPSHKSFKGVKRPQFLVPRYVLEEVIANILSNAPQTLTYAKYN